MSIFPDVAPGLYFDPTNSGWGFSLHSDGATGLVGHLFCHGPIGQSLWFVVNQDGLMTRHFGTGFPGEYVDADFVNCGVVDLEPVIGQDGRVNMRLMLSAQTLTQSERFSPARPWPYIVERELVRML